MANPSTTRAPLHGEVVFHPGDTQPTLALLDGLSLVMDRLFEIPGTRLRFGLNSLLLLLPILGDIIPTFISVGIVVIGLSHQRVPRIVAARMMLNSLLDCTLGWIPVVGDLFDLFYKADTRNVRLLQEYAGWGEQQPRATWRHWVFVVGLLALFVFIMVLIALGTIVLIQWLVRRFI
jgi:hypothetical protein